MDRRRMKQIVYGAFYLVVLVAAGSALYFLFVKPAPSCVNGIRDAGEEGVDCGGVCGTLCLPADVRPLRLAEPVRVFRPAPDRVSVLMKIENSNPTLAARSFTYELKLFGATGSLRSLRAQSFIYQGEVKYLAAFVDAPPSFAVARADLSLADPVWAAGSAFKRPVLGVQDREVFAAEDGGLRATGKVANRDTVEVANVVVMAILKNKFGNILGVSQTELAGLAAGEARAFVILHPAIQGADPLRTELLTFGRRP